jgi:hypothetical protein
LEENQLVQAENLKLSITHTSSEFQLLSLFTITMRGDLQLALTLFPLLLPLVALDYLPQKLDKHVDRQSRRTVSGTVAYGVGSSLMTWSACQLVSNHDDASIKKSVCLASGAAVGSIVGSGYVYSTWDECVWMWVEAQAQGVWELVL